METRDQAPLQDVNREDVPPAAVPPPAPRRPLAVAPPAPLVPSLWAVVRAVLFMAFCVAAVLLAGRRWADAYARYRTFHAADVRPSLNVPSPEPIPVPVTVEDPAAKQPREVLFRLEAPAAKTVLLGGSFNNFDAREAPLTRRPDGSWEATLTLPPGQYTYKFKVDGRWTLDPANPERRTGAREASVLNIQ